MNIQYISSTSSSAVLGSNEMTFTLHKMIQ